MVEEEKEEAPANSDTEQDELSGEEGEEKEVEQSAEEREEPEKSPEELAKLIESTIIASNANAERREDDDTHDVVKPDISHLSDAVVDVDGVGRVFLPQVNDYVVVEWEAPWCDTMLFLVTKIDDSSGVVMLWSKQRGNYSTTNYKNAHEAGTIIKLVPEDANIDKIYAALKPQKSVKSQSTALRTAVDIVPTVERRKGRGRPKGSKNRTIDEINTANAELNERRRKRLEMRSARRGYAR